MMQQQRNFLERSVFGSTKVLKVRSFRIWKEAIKEMRLERYLEDQTASLDQCQQVARDLGMVLASEQDGHDSVRNAHWATQEDVQRRVAANEQLRQQTDEQRKKIQFMQERLKLAESFLTQSRTEALQILGEADVFERAKRDFMSDSKSQAPPAYADVDHSVRVRDAAHSVVQHARGLLPQSPEREVEASQRSQRPLLPRTRQPDMQQRYRSRPEETSPPQERSLDVPVYRAPAPPKAAMQMQQVDATPTSWKEQRASSNEALTFDQIDANHDGVITRAEMNAALGLPQQAQPVTFDQIDANHDGVVTRAEFNAAMGLPQQAQPMPVPTVGTVPQSLPYPGTAYSQQRPMAVMPSPTTTMRPIMPVVGQPASPQYVAPPVYQGGVGGMTPGQRPPPGGQLMMLPPEEHGSEGQEPWWRVRRGGNGPVVAPPGQ